MNNTEQDAKLEAIEGTVNEIREALVGTLEKKGFISRLRSVEVIISRQMWGLGIVISAVVGVTVKSFLG